MGIFRREFLKLASSSVTGAAATALQETGEQVSRRECVAALSAALRAPGLGGVECGIINNAKLRNVRHDPVFVLIRTADARCRIGIADEPLAIPNHLPAIKSVL